MQNISLQASHFIGRKSNCRQDFSLQCLPRWGNSIVISSEFCYLEHWSEDVDNILCCCSLNHCIMYTACDCMMKLLLNYEMVERGGSF